MTSDQVKIGFVVSDSGPGHEALSSARAGVEARIGLVNAAGGINGREITYDWRDDGSSASVNVVATEELVRSEPVFGLLAVTTALDPSMDALEAAGIPVVGLAASPGWAKHRNMFSYSYEASPVTIGRYIQSLGGRKVAVLVAGAIDSVPETVAKYIAEMRAAGVNVVGSISYASAAESPSRVVQRIASLGADSIVGFTTAEEFAEIIQAARSAELRIVASVAQAVYDRALLPTFGPALAGVSAPVYFRPFEAGGEAMDRYRDAMARFAPETGVPERQFALLAYVYTDLFIQGLELAGACPTRAAFIEGLRKVTSYDAGGLIEPVSLRDNLGVQLSCYAFVQVSPAGNEFQVVQERVCADGK
ncbi:ABC transporter substrate-binding protein [Parafrankia sp. EAN1pec]|uniref:ABC transporter substrate-binding protein n=1 Tax=Parafrankia sp. (strain EAN1pec) TaxID=298653 RepID=UPI00321B9182